MSSDSTYKLTIEVNPLHPEPLDVDYLIFRLRKFVPEAKQFLDECGASTGNGGTWRTIEPDMREFSLRFCGVLFLIEEETRDYDHKARRYFSEGKAHTIEPVITWPAFAQEMLS